MHDQLVAMVIAAVEEVAAEQLEIAPAKLGGSTELFGADGLLDSIGLVTVVVAVEQAIADRFNLQVALADEKALSQRNSPYRTVDSLASYALAEIEAKRSHGT